MKKVIIILNVAILLVSTTWLIASDYDYEPIVVCLSSVVSIISLLAIKRKTENVIRIKLDKDLLLFIVMTLMTIPNLMFISYFSSAKYLNNQFLIIKIIAGFFWLLNFLYTTSIGIGLLSLSWQKELLKDQKSRKGQINEKLWNYMFYTNLIAYLVSSSFIPNHGQKFLVFTFTVSFYLNIIIFIGFVFFGKTFELRSLVRKKFFLNIVGSFVIVFVMYLLGHSVGIEILRTIEVPIRAVSSLIEKVANFR